MTEFYDIRIDKPTGDWLESERHRIDAEINGPPTPRPAPLPPVPIDEEASYEQWIGLLYACAVFRGVVEHPPRWP